MFKKTLLAAAIGALSFSAFAADVTLYGVVDTGFVYNHNKAEISTSDVRQALSGTSSVGVSAKDDSFAMESGTNSASRFGLKGSEELGSGLTVGFVLENGFSADSGELGEDRLFGRESSLWLKGGYGTFYFGRMGALVSDTGSVGFYGAMASAFGSGWSDNIAGHTFVMADYTSRRDNTITYVSPEFAGTTFYAQYAMGDNGAENKPSTDRYAAIGAKWAGGPFQLGALVDWTNKDSSPVLLGGSTISSGYDIEDAYTFNLTGAYDCGFAKTFLALQYFKDAQDAAGTLSGIGEAVTDLGLATEDDVTNGLRLFSVTGYGVHLSTSFDALGGTWMAGVGYMDGEVDLNVTSQSGAFDGDIKAYTASVGYEYALSKRTKLYTGAGYTQRELETSIYAFSGELENKSFDFVAGLVHRF